MKLVLLGLLVNIVIKTFRTFENNSGGQIKKFKKVKVLKNYYNCCLLNQKVSLKN